MELIPNYKKYRWFYTSSGKLAVGGKSSEQNDILLKKLKSSNKDFIVLHTSTPGSPFTAILADIKKVNDNDIEECAIFTACFSKAWKSHAKKTKIHIFSLAQLHKDKSMKQGTWAISGKIKEIEIPLLLVLTKQENVLRAVPEKSVKNKKDIIAIICPGKISKENFVNKLLVEFNEHFNIEEILSAVPSGGFSLQKSK